MHNEHVQLCFATFSSLHNKIQWKLLTSHILYWQKQKAGQWREETRLHLHIMHIQLFARTIFGVCIFSFSLLWKMLVLNIGFAAVGRGWWWHSSHSACGKVSSASSLLWLGLCLPICCTTAPPGWQSLSPTLTVKHILLKRSILTSQGNYLCVRIIPVLACAYICMDAYTNRIVHCNGNM